MSNSRRMIGTALVALLAGPAAVPAQQPAGLDDRGSNREPEAQTLYGSRATLLAAAREQVTSASVSPARLEASRELARAGHLYFYAGHSTDALRVLEQSADLALQQGDVVFAADVLLRAAAVASQARLGERAERLASRAELLSGSPLLSPSQRLAIVGRVNRGEARLVGTQ